MSLQQTIFDGSDTFISGNGVYVEHGCTSTAAVCIPTGNGGGCVDSGPFKDMVVNLSPAGSGFTPKPPIPAPQGQFGHNPRCLRRDISSWSSSQWTSDDKTWDLQNYGTNIDVLRTMTDRW